MTAFLRDLRYSAWSLSRSPALTVGLLATVAIGTGTHAAVGGFINGLLSRTLAVPDAHVIAAIHWRETGDRFGPVPADRFAALRQAASSFESLAAFRESRATVTLGDRTAWMSLVEATPEIWDVLRIPAMQGRVTFRDSGGAPRIPVVISAAVWRDQFGGRADAIGSDIVVGGRAGAIAGVLPEWFEGIHLGRAIDAWVPLGDEGRGARGVRVLGRLRDGTTIDEAQEEVAAIAAATPAPAVMAYSGTEPDVQLRLARLKQLLEWAAALVFMTAAANVAGFLLSRAARRAHETATRVALGATSRRLASLVLADAVVISVAGGVLGGIVAFWTASIVPALLYAEDAEKLRLVADASQTATSAGAYTAIMVVCALAPVLQIGQHGTMTVLRRTGGAGATSSGWLRSALVVAQISICVVLVIGTALLFQGFREALRTVRAGRIGQSVVVPLEASGGYARERAGQEYFRRAEAEVARVAGVTWTAWTGTLPGARTWGASLRLQQPPEGSRDVIFDVVTPQGRELVALSLKAGRPFGGADGPFSCRVAMVNETLAGQYFGGAALGRSIYDATGRRIDIVGVVSAAAPAGGAREPTLYFYERQAVSPPSRGVQAQRFALPLLPAAPPTVAADVDINIASRTYFDAIGAALVEGPGFEEAGAAAGCDVAVISREAAEVYFQRGAIGGAVIDQDGRRAEIVGVVDAGALRLMQRRAEPMVFFPSQQRFLPRMVLIAGIERDSPELLAEIATRLGGVVGGAREPVVLTLEEHLSRTSLGPERIATVLIGASAAVALGLGLLGVYGVMADSVARKRRDIALRLALGAPARAIVAGVFRDGLRVAAAGAGAGLLVAWVVVQAVIHSDSSFRAPAAWAWMACPLVLLAVVCLATVLPARWALAVDPLLMTREE